MEEAVLSEPGCSGLSRSEEIVLEKPRVLHSISDCDSDSSSGSSTDGAEPCAICLSRLRGSVGTPESCNHVYCLECILAWGESNPTCPQDRQPFSFVKARNYENIDDSDVIIPLPKREQKKTSKDEQDPGIPVIDLVDDTNETFCEVCGRSDREAELLLCDGCDLGYHLDCLTPPLQSVPVEEWFCATCDHHLAAAQTPSGTQGCRKPRDKTPRGVNTNYGRSSLRILPRTREVERVRQRIRTIRKKRHERVKNKRSKSRDQKPSKRNRTEDSSDEELPKKKKEQFKFLFFGAGADDIDAMYNDDPMAEKLLLRSEQSDSEEEFDTGEADIPLPSYIGHSEIIAARVQSCLASSGTVKKDHTKKLANKLHNFKDPVDAKDAEVDFLGSLLDSQSTLLNRKANIGQDRKLQVSERDKKPLRGAFGCGEMEQEEDAQLICMRKPLFSARAKEQRESEEKLQEEANENEHRCTNDDATDTQCKSGLRKGVELPHYKDNGATYHHQKSQRHGSAQQNDRRKFSRNHRNGYERHNGPRYHDNRSERREDHMNSSHMRNSNRKRPLEQSPGISSSRHGNNGSSSNSRSDRKHDANFWMHDDKSRNGDKFRRPSREDTGRSVWSSSYYFNDSHVKSNSEAPFLSLSHSDMRDTQEDVVNTISSKLLPTCSANVSLTTMSLPRNLFKSAVSANRFVDRDEEEGFGGVKLEDASLKILSEHPESCRSVQSVESNFSFCKKEASGVSHKLKFLDEPNSIMAERSNQTLTYKFYTDSFSCQKREDKSDGNSLLNDNQNEIIKHSETSRHHWKLKGNVDKERKHKLDYSLHNSDIKSSNCVDSRYSPSEDKLGTRLINAKLDSESKNGKDNDFPKEKSKLNLFPCKPELGDDEVKEPETTKRHSGAFAVKHRSSKHTSKSFRLNSELSSNRIRTDVDVTMAPKLSRSSGLSPKTRSPSKPKDLKHGSKFKKKEDHVGTVECNESKIQLRMVDLFGDIDDLTDSSSGNTPSLTPSTCLQTVQKHRSKLAHNTSNILESLSHSHLLHKRNKIKCAYTKEHAKKISPLDAEAEMFKVSSNRFSTMSESLSEAGRAKVFEDHNFDSDSITFDDTHKDCMNVMAERIAQRQRHKVALEKKGTIPVFKTVKVNENNLAMSSGESLDENNFEIDSLQNNLKDYDEANSVPFDCRLEKPALRVLDRHETPKGFIDEITFPLDRSSFKNDSDSIKGSVIPTSSTFKNNDSKSGLNCSVPESLSALKIGPRTPPLPNEEKWPQDIVNDLVVKPNYTDHSSKSAADEDLRLPGNAATGLPAPKRMDSFQSSSDMSLKEKFKPDKNELSATKLSTDHKDQNSGAKFVSHLLSDDKLLTLDKAGVVGLVKLLLDPHYRSGAISRESYKLIVGKCVDKVVAGQTAAAGVDKEKVNALVKGYVAVYQHRQNKTQHV